MRTTIEISEILLKKAMKVTQEKTKTAVVKRGLEALLDRAAQAALIELGGRIKIEPNLESSRKR